MESAAAFVPRYLQPPLARNYCLCGELSPSLQGISSLLHDNTMDNRNQNKNHSMECVTKGEQQQQYQTTK